MSTDPTLAAILANILDHPDEDLPRLAYADRLEESGEAELAAAIRYAIWVSRANAGDPANMPPPAWHPNGRDEWESRGLQTYQERGFMCAVRCAAALWLQWGDAILQAHPVQRVTLTTWPEGTATRANRLRKWKQPSRLGGHVLDSWRAEWPGVAFTLPDLPGHLPGVGERVAAQVAAQFAREDFGDAPPPRPAFGTATAAEVADALDFAREQDRLDAEMP